MKLQYIVDEKGLNSAVIVSIEDFNKINNENKLLKKKLKILTGLNEALDEVEEIKKGTKKGKP